MTYVTVSHFQTYFSIADNVKVTCKPSLISRSFPSRLFGKQEDTVRQNTEVARLVQNK